MAGGVMLEQHKRDDNDRLQDGTFNPMDGKLLQPTEKINAPERIESSKAPIILCESMAELVHRVRTEPLPKMLVGELVAESTTALVHGQPRSRKTFACLELAISVASGGQAFHLKRFQCEQAPVLYMTEEDSDYATVNRSVWIARSHGLGDLVDGMYFMVRKGTDLDDVKWQQQVVEIMLKLGIRLLIIDPARSLTSCVDGGPRDLDPFAEYVRRIKRETGAAILIAHHDLKPPAIAAMDERDHPHKASGGGIFSISDAPIYCQRIGKEQSLLVPSHFKFGKSDPEAFIIRIETPDESEDGPDYDMAILGETKGEQAAINEDMERKVIDAVGNHPCESQEAIVQAVGRRAKDARQALKRLAADGRVIEAKLLKGNGNHYRPPGMGTCGKCKEVP